MSKPRGDAALLVVAGGIAAALHVGRLPTAMPVLRQGQSTVSTTVGWQCSGVVTGACAAARLLLSLAIARAVRRPVATI